MPPSVARCCTRPAIPPARSPRSAPHIPRCGQPKHSGKNSSCSLPWGRRSRCGARWVSRSGRWLACLLGALNALVGTSAGRSLLARVGSAVVANAIAGSIEVGEVRGSLLTGVVLTDVRLLDPDSTLVAWLPRAELGYNPIDFAAGRVVFMEVRLERPIINIVQHASGKTNFDEL